MSLFKSSETVKPEELHDKVLLWGPQHTGKTHTLLTWPDVVLVDAETRSAHFHDRFKFLLAECSTIEQVAAALKEIQSGGLACQTIGVDSATAIYYKFVEKYTELNSKGKPVTDWVAVNRRMLAFINFVFGIAGKNVVFTAHAGEKLVRQGQDFTKAGLQFIGDQKFRYVFDYVFRIESKGDPRKSPAVFHVEKSASPALTVGQAIQGLDYAKFIELTRSAGSSSARQTVAAPPLRGEALADAQARGDAKADGEPITQNQAHAIEAMIRQNGYAEVAVKALVRDCTSKRTMEYLHTTSAEAADIIRRLPSLKVAVNA